MAQAPTVQAAPASEHSRNTRRAETGRQWRAARRPACHDETELQPEVSVPTAAAGQPSLALQVGHDGVHGKPSEVPANCAVTSTGSTWRGTGLCRGLVPSHAARPVRFELRAELGEASGVQGSRTSRIRFR